MEKRKRQLRTRDVRQSGKSRKHTPTNAVLKVLDPTGTVSGLEEETCRGTIWKTSRHPKTRLQRTCESHSPPKTQKNTFSSKSPERSRRGMTRRPPKGRSSNGERDDIKNSQKKFQKHSEGRKDRQSRRTKITTQPHASRSARFCPRKCVLL